MTVTLHMCAIVGVADFMTLTRQHELSHIDEKYISPEWSLGHRRRNHISAARMRILNSQRAGFPPFTKLAS